MTQALPQPQSEPKPQRRRPASSRLSANSRDFGLGRPSANLLEIMHARNLRDHIVGELTRLQRQSCGLNWAPSVAEFGSLYYGPLDVFLQDPLQADEVGAHYQDLLVAMNHLLQLLGDNPDSFGG